jgi:hypothetical protein
MSLQDIISAPSGNETSPLIRTLKVDHEPPSVKIQLHDGVNPISRISVLALYRSCNDYLKFALKQFTNWEARYNTEFEYFFIENDSKDDTREILKDFFKSHQGRLLAGKLDKDYVNLGENFDRTMTLAHLRNALVDAVTPLQSQYTIFIDSNIFFSNDILERMFSKTQPALNNIGMITPYTAQIHTIRMLKNLGFQVQVPQDTADDTVVNLRVAFDTFSFVDKDHRTHFPMCPFEKCMLCANIRPKTSTLQLYPESDEVVDVRSAFSGFAIIESSILSHPRIRWSTFAFDNTGRMSLCEHTIFCDRLITVTGKRVVVVQSVDDIYRTY